MNDVIRNTFMLWQNYRHIVKFDIQYHMTLSAVVVSTLIL